MAVGRGSASDEARLWIAYAARRLEMPTKELLRLIYERKIRYVMVKGIARIPDDAVEEFRASLA